MRLMILCAALFCVACQDVAGQLAADDPGAVVEYNGNTVTVRAISVSPKPQHVGLAQIMCVTEGKSASPLSSIDVGEFATDHLFLCI